MSEEHPIVDWLADAIAKLDAANPDDPVVDARTDMAASILDEHEGWEIGGRVDCRLCAPFKDIDEGHVPIRWPCETLRLVAWSFSADVAGYDRAWMPDALRYENFRS